MLVLPKGYLKFAGWSLLIGGVAGIIGQLLHLEDAPASIEEIPHFVQGAVNNHVLLAWSTTLILLGIPAMFLRLAEKLKLWGWIGFPLLFIGMMLEIFHSPFQIFAYPIIFDLVKDEATLKAVTEQINNTRADIYPLTLTVLIPMVPGIILGILLLGIATIHARVLPRWVGIVSLAALGVAIAGMVFKANTFPLILLIFAVFGAVLAFERKPALLAKAKTEAEEIRKTL